MMTRANCGNLKYIVLLFALIAVLVMKSRQNVLGKPEALTVVWNYPIKSKDILFGIIKLYILIIQTQITF